MANFAVIETGAKQYKVEKDSKIKIEKIKGDYKVGDKLTFANVLLSVQGDEVKIGSPYLDNKVEAEIIKIAHHKKVEVVKYMPKSRYFKKNGHKQPYFEVKVLAI